MTANYHYKLGEKKQIFKQLWSFVVLGKINNMEILKIYKDIIIQIVVLVAKITFQHSCSFEVKVFKIKTLIS